MAALRLQASPVSQELLAFLVPDEVVGSITPIKDVNDILTGLKLLPQVSLEVSLPLLEVSPEMHSSLPQGLTHQAVALLDSTHLHDDRRTFLALDGLGFYHFSKQITTLSSMAKIRLWCRSGKPAVAGI